MIEQIAEKLRDFFKTDKVEIVQPNKIELFHGIVIEYTSNDEIIFTDTTSWNEEAYSTNLENLCNDIQKEIWV